MWEIQGERLIGAAGCVAGAQRCFDKTLQYALERKAFGRQIGNFQAIRHKFADMAIGFEGTKRIHAKTAVEITDAAMNSSTVRRRMNCRQW